MWLTYSQQQAGLFLLDTTMNDFFSKLTDIELLARLIYGEARGEGVQGMTAVAWVALNRAANPSWWGTTLRQCILKPYQFSCFNDAYSAALITPRESVWIDCVRIALLTMTGGVADPTNGATSYHASYMTPDWAASMTRVAVIGNHVFYK